MDPEKQKEQYSSAFIQAASAVAGFTATAPSVDDDSIDWNVHSTGGGGTVRSPRLDIQVKSTTAPDFHGDVLHYALKVKNYDDLIPDNVMVPRILVVVSVPANVDEWQALTHEHMQLRRCAYWVSLRGMPVSDTLYTKTVLIPKLQTFDGASLKQIMSRVEMGQLP